MSGLKRPQPPLLAHLCSFLFTTHAPLEALSIRQPMTSLRPREGNRNQGTEHLLKDKTRYQHQESPQSPQTLMPCLGAKTQL